MTTKTQPIKFHCSVAYELRSRGICMRFSERALGRQILNLPIGETVLSIGRSLLSGYYRLRHSIFKLYAIPWIIGQSQDRTTRRVMFRRLAGDERAKKYLSIHLSCAGGPIVVRPTMSDVDVVVGIFFFGEYRPVRGWNYSSILDCGANGGIFAAFAQSQAGSTLSAYVGVEPDPDAFALLSEQVNIRGIDRIATLIEVAVSDRDGTARFDNGGASWSHRISEMGALEVQTLTINSILDRAGLKEVDLLKLDIEGGEKRVLESLPKWRHRVKHLVVELHNAEQPLDYAWFAAIVRAGGFEPMPAGTLFQGLPGAVRQDVFSL